MVGQTISNYRIIEKIGGGGMGEVYRARDLTLDRDVALKFLPKKLSDRQSRSTATNGSSDPRLRFMREAKAASALDHPNICTIYAIDQTEEGQLFIAMAWYDGETLSSRIERGPLSQTTIADLGAQIAAGLEAAHERKLIHRDIKPANVMVTPEGVVKILDFGLSKFLRRPSEITRSGDIMGTAAYMSPEQVKEEAVDERTDVWSLGVVLYEMATGEKPFRGHTDMSILYRIVNHEPNFADESARHVSPQLSWILHRCLVKKPEERYSSMTELRDDLEALHPNSEVTTLPSRALPAILAWRLRRTLRRFRQPLTLAAILAAALLAAGVIFRPWADVPAATQPPREAAVETAAETISLRIRGADDPELAGVLRDLTLFALPSLHWRPVEDDGVENRLREDGLPSEQTGPAVDGEIRRRDEPRAGAFEIALRLSAGSSDPRPPLDLRLEGHRDELFALAAELAARLGPELGLAIRPGPTSGTANVEPSEASREIWNKARDALAAEDAITALDYLDRIRALEPELAVVADARAQALISSGQLIKAEQATAAALARARALPWPTQLSYWIRNLERQREWGRAAALLKILWRENAGTWPARERREQGFRMALALARAGKGEAARALLGNLEEQAPGDPRLELIEAEAAKIQSRYHEQLQAARRAAEAARRAGAPALLAQALTLQGLALRRAGDAEAAFEVLEQAREQYAAIGLRRGEAEVWNIEGMIFWDQQDLLPAQERYERAAAIFEKLGAPGMQGATLHNVALVLRQYGDADAALKVFHDSFEQLSKTGDPNQVLVLVNIADLYSTTGDLARAADIYPEALAISEHGPPINRATVLMGYGELLLIRGAELARVDDYLTRALEHFEETGEAVYTSDALVRLGRLRRVQGDLAAAQQAYEKAGSLVREKDVNFAQTLRGLGEIFILRNELATARDTLDHALVLLDRTRHPWRSLVLLSRAWLSLVERDPAAAEARAREAIPELEHGWPLEAARAYGILARALLDQARMAEAREAIEQGHALLSGLLDDEAMSFRLPLAIADAHALAREGDPVAADQILQNLIAIAARLRLPEVELEALLAQDEIALARNADHGLRSRFERVELRARDKGFDLIASRAAEAGRQSP